MTDKRNSEGLLSFILIHLATLFGLGRINRLEEEKELICKTSLNYAKQIIACKDDGVSLRIKKRLHITFYSMGFFCLHLNLK